MPEHGRHDDQHCGLRSHDGAASRPLIVATVVVMAAFVVVDALISTRSFWANDVLHALVGLFLLAALVGYALSLLPRGPWPAQFEVREGSAFVVPASRQYGYFVAAQVMLSGALLDRAIDGWTEPVAAEATISRVVTSATLVLAVLVVGIVARTLVTALPRGPPSVTPDALVVRDGRHADDPVDRARPTSRRSLVPSDHDAAGGAARTHRPAWTDVENPRRAGVARCGSSPMPSAIRDPDRRDLIGTSAEHERRSPTSARRCVEGRPATLCPEPSRLGDAESRRAPTLPPMGMYGEWLRLRPAEGWQADLAWAHDRLASPSLTRTPRTWPYLRHRQDVARPTASSGGSGASRHLRRGGPGRRPYLTVDGCGRPPPRWPTSPRSGSWTAWRPPTCNGTMSTPASGTGPASCRGPSATYRK